VQRIPVLKGEDRETFIETAYEGSNQVNCGGQQRSLRHLYRHRGPTQVYLQGALEDAAIDALFLAS
jgi:hypothetical protein